MNDIASYAKDFCRLEADDLVYQLLVVLLILLFGEVVLRFIIKRAVYFLIKRSRFNKNSDFDENLKNKAETISSMLYALGNIFLWGVVVILVLGIIGIDIRPIIAGAGIFAFAVGFGSQALVKDFISGIFIIAENQFNVGDEVKIGNFSGKVVKFSPRLTILQNKEGSLVYLSNGSISNVINISQSHKNENIN